ncbi:hypothetical protein MNV49_006514 [Pseudohyphozyma bogoriensis]|nr:hypothetical protein MNV49_006514 [Pseudohyphozyma bogoriensis]
MSSVNDIESASPVIKGVPMSSEQIHAATGTVNLISDEKDVVLVPAPSSDPRDPLNLSTPRKWAIAVILSLYYVEAGKSYNDIVHLITIPTLSMGLGNLLFVPMALAVGRRPIYLFSCALLFIACIIAGQNTNYEYHLAIRIVIGFAAGQSEALVPLMLKESFFLHERANILSFQSSFQAIIGCALSICSSNIAASYNVYAGISGAIFVASVLLVPETKFDRPLEAYNGLTATTPGAAGVNLSKESVQRWEHPTGQVTEATRPPLDHSLGKAWSLKTMLNPMPSVTVNWAESWALVKHMLTMIMFPNLFLVIITNAWFLGVNVAQGTTYGTVLTGPGYHWADKWTGVAQAGKSSQATSSGASLK